MPTTTPLGFHGTRPVYTGPGGGRPHEQFVYDFVADGMAEGLEAHQIMVQYPQLGLKLSLYGKLMTRLIDWLMRSVITGASITRACLSAP